MMLLDGRAVGLINSCPISLYNSPSKSRQAKPTKNLNDTVLLDGCLTLDEDCCVKLSKYDLQQLKFLPLCLKRWLIVLENQVVSGTRLLQHNR